MPERGSSEDRELEEYRSLMEPPDTFEEGFNLKSIVGAFFIGLVMMPGAIYLGLIAGQGMGPAAEWVTIILFSEAARRSFSTLRRQEIYVLYYIAGGLSYTIGGLALSGGPFAGLIWNQYFVQSTAAKGFGIAGQIPSWVTPSADSAALIHRTFFDKAWVPAISILIFGQVASRFAWFGAGYSLFRLTSDVENLPFPLAPIAAQGATALAEVGEERETWRWRVFVTGMMVGIFFGIVYIGLPALSGLVMDKPLNLLPIPWIDLTPATESVLPAAPIGIATDLGVVFIGFVLPFWVVVGGFLAALVYTLANPILYHAGYLTTWRPGMGTITTIFVNSVDLWLSITIGTGFSVAMVGLVKVVGSARKVRERRERVSYAPPPGRGDIPLWAGIGLYTVSVTAYIALCIYLLEDDEFPLAFLLIFGFFLTPLLSYVNARMVGLTGQMVGFPMIREGAFILSGYKGIDIWFAPIPYHNYGAVAQMFRQFELTGTKFTSIIKAEMLMVPVGLGCSFLFWSLIWRTNAIPAPIFQYAQKFWHLNALQQSLWYSATTEGNRLFMEAIKFKWIFAGFGFGILSYVVLSFMGLPVMLVYGFIRGLGQIPHYIFPEMVAALIGRYYFQERFGLRTWRQYTPVLAAGYSAGIGLIGMGAVAIALISKSISQLPY